MFDSFFEGVVVGVGDAVELAQTARVGVVFAPFGDAAEAEEVALVFEQFLEARPGPR